LFYVLFLLIVLYYVLFVCKCVLYYCHWVSTQLHLNMSYHHSEQLCDHSLDHDVWVGICLSELLHNIWR